VDQSSGRNETELERLDRNLNELLQELRVAQTGVQILFAFLLSLPFTRRFTAVTSFQRGVYLWTIVFAAAATAFLIAPVPFHRLVFRQRDKRYLVFAASRMALAGLFCLGVALISAMFFVTDFLFRARTVVPVVLGVAALYAWLWVVVPLYRRAQASHEPPVDTAAVVMPPGADEESG
jgi:predicted neutral ceramidase superfamily lipid hydrolase